VAHNTDFRHCRRSTEGNGRPRNLCRKLSAPPQFCSPALSNETTVKPTSHQVSRSANHGNGNMHTAAHKPHGRATHDNRCSRQQKITCNTMTPYVTTRYHIQHHIRNPHADGNTAPTDNVTTDQPCREDSLKQPHANSEMTKLQSPTPSTESDDAANTTDTNATNGMEHQDNIYQHFARRTLSNATARTHEAQQ